MYNSMQKLNICMSYQGSLDIVNKMCEQHDVEVQFWKEELERKTFSHVRYT